MLLTAVVLFLTQQQLIRSLSFYNLCIDWL